MQNFLESINGVIWGLPMLIFFIFTALRLTVHGKFFQFTHLSYIFKKTIGSILKKETANSFSDFSAFCSVLGACIGTGNIVGVATALYAGGPGTVFWMVLSAFFAMMTAYSENYLGISYKRKDRYGNISGGAFSYIENGLKMKNLAKIYSFFCLLSALGMGNMAQSNSIADSLKNSFDLPPFVTAIFLTITTVFIISGGLKRIGKIQTLLVPAMCIFFFILSAIVLFKHKNNIPSCIILVLKEAFSLKSIKGFGIYKAARYGISRGVFSNEAGLGSSTIIHSQSKDTDGTNQGLWAMLEVFIDTIVMCSITAIVLLVSTNNNKAKLFGTELSITAYGCLGEVGKKGIGLMTAIFAFSSLSSCCFYGEKSFEYFFGKKMLPVYKVIYLSFVFLGCVNPAKTIWSFADICNGLMAIPNLFALNTLKNEVFTPILNKKAKPRQKMTG